MVSQAGPGQIIPAEDVRKLRAEYRTRPAPWGCRVLVSPSPTARQYGLGVARYAWLLQYGVVGAPGDDRRGMRVIQTCKRRDCVRHLAPGGYTQTIAKWRLTICQ
jgi:hypothetical protein